MNNKVDWDEPERDMTDEEADYFLAHMKHKKFRYVNENQRR